MNDKKGYKTLTPSTKSINAQVTVPGSKSYTNRAMILAALCANSTVLKNISLSDDSKLLLENLKKLGVKTSLSENTLIISGAGFKAAKVELYCGAAGTTLRFLLSLCSLVPDSEITLSGTERLHQRPVADLVEALRALGAEIEYLQTKGCPPLLVRGGALSCNAPLEISGATSSQFISSLLLTGSALPSGLNLSISGGIVSGSYIEMTLAILKVFGVQVEHQNYQSFTVPTKQYRSPGEYLVEGDASGASYFFGIAAISGGTVRVNNISFKSLQGDAQFPRLLEKMGCRVTTGSDAGVPWISVTGPKKLRSIEADMTLMPDTAQTLAVIATVAQGVSQIGGLSTLRHKETDRIAALCAELSKIGIKTEVKGDKLRVCGGTPRGAIIETYEDHRMAMAFAMLGVRVSGITISQPEVVSKSYPEFWTDLHGIL